MFSRKRLQALALALLVSLAASGPAHALPVFSSSGLSEEAISPTGDGIQDFTVILYTVEVDTALVRIVLRHAGGAIRDTLQVFSREGRGTHTLPFDGNAPRGTVPDGSYTIEILGVGTQGEGTETATHPLTIDRIPPPITSWDVVAPGATLENGDLLTLQVCAAENPDSVSLDLSSLDSAFDPTFVTTTPFGTNCFRFEYAISIGNTLPDAAAIPARVRLADRAGNVSEAVLDLCLSNSPPVMTDLSIESDILRDGFNIVVNVSFSSPNIITPGADFSIIDSQFTPDALQVEDRGNQNFTLRYQISFGNSPVDGEYELVVYGTDQGCGYVADSLLVTLDNAGEFATLLENVRISRASFCPAGLPGESVGYPSVLISFDVIADSVRVGVVAESALLRNPSQREIISILRQLPEPLPRGSHTIPWDGSGISVTHNPERLDEQELMILVTSANQIGYDDYRIPLRVDRTPPQLFDFPPPEDLVARNGDVLRIPVSYDTTLESLAADLSGLDSRNSGPVTAIPKGFGDYEILYEVDPTNTRLDSTNIAIPLTAVDLAGNRNVSTLVRACLNNLPPQLIGTPVLLGSQGPFRNGQRISIRTQWATEATQDNLQVTADFSAIDDAFNPNQVAVVPRENNVFEIGYTLSAANTIPNGIDLPVRVTASDDPSRGCGSTTVDAVKVSLDNVDPEKPTLMASANIATEPFVTLSGTAPGAVQVQIDRAAVPIDTLDVEPLNFTFSGQVGLVPGENLFTARSIDAAGNLSTVSGAGIKVFLFDGISLEVPARFIPNSKFFIASNVVTSGVRVRIFNLDGVEIQRLEGTPQDPEIPWDGTDTSGNMVSSGPYIAVAEIEVDGALTNRLRKAFVFLRGGTAP